jgi:hypothetical protein
MFILLAVAGLEGGEEPSGEKCPPPDSDPFNSVEFGENLAKQSRQFAASAKRRFESHKRSQLFIRVNNETLPVVAVRVSNEDCSPVGIHGCNAAPTPTGFAQIVSDNFPVFRCAATRASRSR